MRDELDFLEIIGFEHMGDVGQHLLQQRPNESYSSKAATGLTL